MPIHPTAMLHPDAKVDPSANIGARTIVGKDVTIGADVTVGADCRLKGHGHGLVVRKGAVIGDGCRIEAATARDRPTSG